MHDILVAFLLAAAVVQPAVVPVPTVGAASSERGPLHQLVWQAALDHGISPWLLTCITDKEQGGSDWNPNAVSATNDYGLDQFHDPSSPTSLWARSPYASYSVYNPWANAEAAAWWISRGELHQWSTWSLCQ